MIILCPLISQAMETHLVKRVVDGDTLLLDNNRFVRYIGINAPEVQHGNENEEPFGITDTKDLRQFHDRTGITHRP